MNELPPTTALPRTRGEAAVLIIDDSVRDSDLLYASGFNAGDAFTFVEFDGRRHLILSDLEIGRGEKEARVDRVVAYSDLEREVLEGRADDQNNSASLVEVVIRFLRNEGLQRLRVPGRFPVRYADRLRQEGFVVEVGEEPFYPERLRKSSQEVAWIEQSQSDTEAVMESTIALIRRSSIGDDRVLELDGEPLTAERVKRHIRRELLERDYVVGDPIVAPGDQGCDPHNTGSGKLRADESIIIDIFPRSLTTHYWGDMTRTIVKGKASDELLRVHAAVARAQDAAFEAVRPGTTGGEVHRSVQEVFENEGFKTERHDGTWRGFFHGTGHGIGLEIHEGPRLGKSGKPLEPGMVVTVEPGLYYPGIGGVRLEDVVVVTDDGCRNLNRASRDLVI